WSTDVSLARSSGVQSSSSSTSNLFATRCSIRRELGRFSFGKEVDLKFEVVAPFQRLVNSALAYQYAGSKQNSFESEDHREQGKRIFIEGMLLKNKIGGDPAEAEAH